MRSAGWRQTAPASGGISPLMIFSSVDLPVPLRPISDDALARLRPAATRRRAAADGRRRSTRGPPRRAASRKRTTGPVRRHAGGRRIVSVPVAMSAAAQIRSRLIQAFLSSPTPSLWKTIAAIAWR